MVFTCVMQVEQRSVVCMCVEKLDDYERRLVAVKLSGDRGCPMWVSLVFAVSPYNYQCGISWFFGNCKIASNSRVYN